MAKDQLKREAKRPDPEFVVRLSQAINAAGGVRSVMRETGISDTQLRRYIDGKSSPSSGKLKQISDCTGFSLNWLLSGENPLLSDDNIGENSPLRGEVVRVPLLTISAAAGAGAINGSHQTKELIPFPKRFLRGRSANSEKLQFVQAVGDSMSPTIEDGALVLVDLSQAEIVDGGIFIVSLGDEVRIKRVHKSMSGRVTLRSDGDATLFPDEVLDASDAERLVIHGRVFWAERLL